MEGRGGQTFQGHWPSSSLSQPRHPHDSSKSRRHRPPGPELVGWGGVGGRQKPGSHGAPAPPYSIPLRRPGPQPRSRGRKACGPRHRSEALAATAGAPDQRQLIPAVGGAEGLISSRDARCRGGVKQTRRALKPLPGEGGRATARPSVENNSVSADRELVARGLGTPGDFPEGFRPRAACQLPPSARPGQAGHC